MGLLLAGVGFIVMIVYLWATHVNNPGRKLLTYVGACAIAGVIGTLVYVLVKLVDNPKSLEDENLLLIPIYITLYYLTISLPLMLISDGIRWFHRFGFVKRIIAIHLIAWLVFSFVVLLIELLVEGRDFEAVFFFSFS